MRLSLISGVATLLAAAILAGCDAGQAAGDGTVRVVASAYPLAYAAERLAGDAVSVTNLTPPGVEPHDLELTPEDLEAIASADVILLLGGGFQPAVEDAVAAEATGTVVDVMDDLATLPAPEGEEDVAVDPHVWLDPGRYAAVVERIDEALEAVDVPTSDALGRDLAHLDADLRERLAGCEGSVLVTNHAAFGYLADAYGLRQEAIAGLSPETEPTADRLAELAARIRAEGVTTVFTESLVPPDVADTLAAEAGVEVAVLDPLEGFTQERLDAGEDYLTVMRRNAEVLEEGLGC